MLKIDENYHIEFDEHNYTLVFSEEKIAEKGKNIGEKYTAETQYYYPSVYHCLKRYLDLKTKEAKDVETCVNLIEETYEKLKKLSFNR